MGDAETPGTGLTISTDYAAADGRWVRLQANYDHLRRAAAAALGADEDRDAFARAIAARPADEAERAIVEGGGAAAASRTMDEWAAHPQGQAVAGEPLIDSVFGDAVFGDGAPAGWAPVPERPLAGVKVLDVTRVLAGPVGTRTLAGYGAEVLRVDPPGFLEPGGSNGGGDLTLGKRCVYLDLAAPAGRDTFLRLDRPVDRPARLRHPGADQRRLLHRADAARRPPHARLLPSQVLDFATGYLAAAAAIRGLAERARTGRWSSWRLALARTGVLLQAAGPAPEDEAALGEPDDGWYEDLVYNFPKGPVRRLRFPVLVGDGPQGNAPQFWERAGDPYGTATPVWATAPTAGRRA